MKLWPRKQPEFKELLNSEDWQKIQDTFSSVTRISLRTVDPEGKLVTEPSGQSRLCKDFLKESVYGMEVCGQCLPTFLGGKGVINGNMNFICPPGFHNFFAPLRVDNKVFAYIVLGPVILVMRKPKDQYQQLAQELDADLDDLWKAILDIRVISFYRLQTLMELITKVSEFILSLAYDNKTQGKKLVFSFSDRFKNLLELLLDLALQVSGADIGSILFMDKAKNELTIRAAKGLPEAVVKNTKIKLGTGICGSVLKENKPMLIDDSTDDKRIRQQMRRPYLKSSMILPIGVDQNVYGVMNLGALEVSSVRFNQENIDAMQKVIDLTIDSLYMPLRDRIPSKTEYLEQLL